MQDKMHERLIELGPYWPENGDHWIHPFEFIELAKGNLQLAISLRERIEWQHPSTLLEQDIAEGEVIEINGQYVLTGGQEPETKPYLLVVWGDIAPEIKGPYHTPEVRDREAIRHRRDNGDTDGLFMLDVKDGERPVASSYSGGFLEQELDPQTHPTHHNFYRCPDDMTNWNDVWDSDCNSECPACGKEIEPYRSEEIEYEL